MTKIIYHALDHDGQGSAALVKLKYSDAELIGLDYNQPLDFSSFVPGETVYMVDFSLQPYSDMDRLARDYDFHWIDHHFTAISAVKRMGLDPKGLRSLSKSAIELTWEYLNPNEPMPHAVALIGAHDRWDHSDPDALDLFYGLRLEDTSPANVPFWRTLFGGVHGVVQDIVDDGRKIRRYVDRDHIDYAKEAAFEVTLDGVRFIAANRGLTGSKLFDSVYDPERHDACMVFYFQARINAWRFSVYTEKEGVDLGAFAAKRNGGGSPKAAGFRARELPFPVPVAYTH